MSYRWYRRFIGTVLVTGTGTTIVTTVPQKERWILYSIESWANSGTFQCSQLVVRRNGNDMGLTLSGAALIYQKEFAQPKIFEPGDIICCVIGAYTAQGYPALNMEYEVERV